MPSLFAHRAPHRTILLALAALAALVTLIGATAPARAGGDAGEEGEARHAATDDTATIAVHGVAAREVDPDRTVVRFAVQVLDPSASAAVARGGEALSRIVAALEAEAVDTDSLRTTSVSLREEFDWTEEGRVSLGFRYSSGVRLRVDGVDQAGMLLDLIAGAGGDAVRIDGIDFDVGDRAEVERLVLLDAVDDARATAEAIAAHIGMTVLGAAEITVTSSLSPVTRTNAADQEEAAADDSFSLVSSPVFSGTDTVEARVSAIYRLGPAGSTADESGDPAGSASAGRE